jgi:hypothetical protein
VVNHDFNGVNCSLSLHRVLLIGLLVAQFDHVDRIRLSLKHIRKMTRKFNKLVEGSGRETRERIILLELSFELIHFDLDIVIDFTVQLNVLRLLSLNHLLQLEWELFNLLLCLVSVFLESSWLAVLPEFLLVLYDFMLHRAQTDRVVERRDDFFMLGVVLTELLNLLLHQLNWGHHFWVEFLVIFVESCFLQSGTQLRVLSREVIMCWFELVFYFELELLQHF